jgi:urease accessory protein
MKNRPSLKHSPLQSRHALLGLALWCLALGAQAHPGHIGDSSAVNGLMHPLTGLDHLLAMLAVGVYAARQTGRARWLAPLLFLGGLAAGGIAGHLQWAWPQVEAGIAASVLILGLMVIAGSRMPALPGYTLIAGFALCHGYAHGIEAPGASAFEIYSAGFIASCIALQAIGYGATRRLGARHAVWARSGGALVAATGLVMLARVV